MPIEKIKKEVVKYFNREYQDTMYYLTSPYGKRLTTNEVIKCTLDRCMGVAIFAQYLGVPFEFIDKEYENLKEELKNPLDKQSKGWYNKYIK